MPVPGFPVPPEERMIQRAKSAYFFFNVDFHDQSSMEGRLNDWVSFPGQGRVDLDRIINMFDNYPSCRVQLDLGAGRGDTSALYRVSKEDVMHLRDLYVGFWGQTARPNYFVLPRDQFPETPPIVLSTSGTAPW